MCDSIKGMGAGLPTPTVMISSVDLVLLLCLLFSMYYSLFCVMFIGCYNKKELKIGWLHKHDRVTDITLIYCMLMDVPLK